MQCITYAKQRYSELVGGNVPWSGNDMNPIALWNRLPSGNKHGNIKVPSIAIWDGPKGKSHAAVVESINNGTIYITEANFNDDGEITSATFTDVYYLGVHCGSQYTFKGYIQ